MADNITQLQDDAGNNVLPKTVVGAITDMPDFASQIQAVADTANGKIDKGDALPLNASTIGATTDWNTITTSGTYMVSCTNGHQAGTHFPNYNNAASTNGDWGMLFCMFDPSGMGIQAYFGIPGQLYIRSLSGGGWSSWNKATYTTTN